MSVVKKATIVLILGTIIPILGTAQELKETKEPLTATQMSEAVKMYEWCRQKNGCVFMTKQDAVTLQEYIKLLESELDKKCRTPVDEGRR